MPVSPTPTSPSARPSGEAAEEGLSSQARAVLATPRDGISGDGAACDATSGLTDWGTEAIRHLTAELGLAPPPRAAPGVADGPR